MKSKSADAFQNLQSFTQFSWMLFLPIPHLSEIFGKMTGYHYRIICHFHVRKASDNCYCDNFFDIVVAQIMLTVHADFWHVHAKFNRGAHNNVMIIIFSWFFGGKDAPAISIFSRPLYVAQSKMNDPFNQIWKSNIKYFKTNSVYKSTLSYSLKYVSSLPKIIKYY